MRVYFNALLVVACKRVAGNQFEEALDACQRILAIDAWQENAVFIGMQACVGFNDRAGAMRLYVDLEHTLRNELNTTPKDELRALYESLL